MEPPPDCPPPDSRRIRCSPRAPSTAPRSKPGSDGKAGTVAAATKGIVEEEEEDAVEEAKEEDG